MDIRKMRVAVGQRIMAMRMRVGLAWRIIRTVAVLVMLVVRVKMVVIEGFVAVLVLVAFGEVQPNPNTHEESRHHKSSTPRFS